MKSYSYKFSSRADVFQIPAQQQTVDVGRKLFVNAVSIQSCMTKLLSILFCGSIVFVSCQKRDYPTPTRTPDEQQIATLINKPNYLYPSGFYQEPSAYYENTISVKPLSNRPSQWVELSTNDRNQALSWSDSSDKYSSDHRTLLSFRETEKYFEFKRQSPLVINDSLLSRVHKTTYFYPLLDLFRLKDTIGIYNGLLSSDKTKELVEYLWSSGSMGRPQERVVASQTSDSTDYFQHYIKSFYIIFFDIGSKDSVYVYDNFFKLDKSTRILTKSSTFTKAFAL